MPRRRALNVTPTRQRTALSRQAHVLVHTVCQWRVGTNVGLKVLVSRRVHIFCHAPMHGAVEFRECHMSTILSSEEAPAARRHHPESLEGQAKSVTVFNVVLVLHQCLPRCTTKSRSIRRVYDYQQQPRFSFRFLSHGKVRLPDPSLRICSQQRDYRQLDRGRTGI